MIDQAIKRLDDTVMFYGKMQTEFNRDIKMMSRAEDTFGLDPKEVKKVKTALMIVDKYYNKKQEIVALEIEQMKEE